MTLLTRCLMGIGCLFLLVGVIAGVVNREILDGQRFADNVEGVRSDSVVQREAGIIISNALIRSAPDLTVARPLVESTSASLVGSPAFGPVIRTAVVPVHDAFTAEGSDSVVLRLADVGAVLVSAVRAVAPQAAESLPADLDITLANFGGQGFSDTTIKYTHLVKYLAWILPLLALLCFAGAVLVGGGRRQEKLRTVGVVITATGAIVAAAIFVVGAIVSRLSPGNLVDAIGLATWRQLSGPLWAVAAVLAAGGYVVIWAAGMQLGEGFRAPLVRSAKWLRNPPKKDRVAHGALILGLGVAVLLRPATAVTVAVAVAGFILVLNGIAELAAAVISDADERVQRVPRLLGRPEVRTGLVAITAFAAIAGLVVWNARPPQQAVALIGEVSPDTCNGHAELCDRRFDEVAYPSTHNSMSAADEDGWFLAEQPTGILGQLRDGIRVFLIDTWPGQQTQRAGFVANSNGSRGAALAEATDEYGGAVLQSALRLREASSLRPVGAVEPYMCHAVCELGATPWEPVMKEVGDWMKAHPREVVTFFIQDKVSPADTAAVLNKAGLMPFIHTQKRGEPWPTLREMINSGRRLVVMAERTGGGIKFPWLLQGFDWVQDTPYEGTKVSDFSCDLLRGKKDASLFLVNHWLNRPQYRLSDSAKVNSSTVLGPRLDRCRDQRGHLPNFITVDYYNLGDLFTEVDRLNGLG